MAPIRDLTPVPQPLTPSQRPQKKKLKRVDENRDPNENIPIYNFVSGPNTLTFQENTDVILEKILEVPSAQAIWYPWGLPFRSVFWYRVFAIFVHVIPGFLLDIAFVIKGSPPILTSPHLVPYLSTHGTVLRESPTGKYLTLSWTHQSTLSPIIVYSRHCPERESHWRIPDLVMDSPVHPLTH
uniref:Uncharacterized protein n=1 Tax=Timema douglasi TaxID=61478 RepID=A0A7R8VSI8_TIMDO|nr:unnamed protein product [Timema douglasi]